jgi:autotransporter-associated beta strand protein
MRAYSSLLKSAVRFRLISTFAATVAALALGALSAPGQNITWDGGSGNASLFNWSDGTNWVGGTAPAAASNLFFDGTVGLSTTNNIAAGTSFNGLNFNSTAGNFTLAGNSITLAGNLADNAVGNESISLAIALAQASNFTVASGGLTSISGVISGGFALNYNGTGTLDLTLANTFTGGANLYSGTVIIGNAAALGTGTIILDGGTLAGNVNTVSNPITVTGTSTIFQNGSTNLTLSGTMTVNAGAVLNILIPGGNTTTTNSAGSTSGGNGIVGNGTIELGASTGTLRLNSGTSTNHGGGNILLDLGTATAKMQSRDGGTTFFWGALEGGSGTVLLGAGSSGAASTYSIGNSGQSTTFSGSIENGNSGSTNTVTNFAKTGVGTLTLLGGLTSNYTGNTTISGGTLAVEYLSLGGSNSSIGISSSAATNLNITNGTLQYLGAGSTTDRLFTVGAGALVGGTGAVAIDASGTGNLTFSNAGSIAFNTAQANLLTLTGNNTGTNTFHPIIPDQTAGTDLTSVVKSGIGEWALTGLNTYSGVTTISGGTLAVTDLDIGGNSSGIGSSSSAASNLIFNGGSLQYTGPGNTTDRLFTVAANTTLDASGTGPLFFSGGSPLTFTANATAPQNYQLTFTGSNTGTNTFSPIIADIDGTNLTSVVKNGAGQWVFSSANTYSGGTTVNSGTLTVINGSGSALGTGAVTLNSGGTLAGTGKISGLVTANPGSTLVSGTTSVGLLTLGSLTLAANSGGLNATLNFDFTSNTSYDQINVTGLNGLTINGGALNLFATGTTNAWSSPGTYDLIQFNGAIQGSYASSLNNLIVLNAQPGINYTFGSNSTFLTLTIASANNPNTWNVDANGNWGTGTNWTNNAVPTSGALVNFLSIISAPRTITLDGSRTVSGLYFNNSNSYTIAPGSGSLSFVNDPSPGNLTVVVGSHTVSTPVVLDADGLAVNTTFSNTSITLSGNISDGSSGAAITKTGNGLLVLSGNNTYSGGTAINGGTVSFAALNSLGTGTSLTLNGGTLQWNGTNTADVTNGGATTVTIASGGATFNTNGNNVTIANPIGNNGAGAFTKAGNGVLVLSAANTYSGGTNINGGTLSFASLASLGTGTSLTLNGGTLQWNGTNTADITNGGLNTVTINSGGATFDTNGNNIALTGNIGNGGSGGVAVIGGGALDLLGTNDTYSGNTSVTGSTLSFAALASLGTGTGLTINGGTLQWNGTNTADVSAGRLVTMGPNGATFDTNGNNVTLSTAIGNGSTGDLTKIGNGNLALAVSPTYTGNTNIDAGTLSIGGSTIFSTTANVTVASGATLNVPAGGSLTLSNLLGTGNINLGSGSLNFNNTVAVTLSNAFSGSGAFNKTGTPTLSLIGTSTGTGALNISNGNVEIDAPGNFSAGGGSTGSTIGTNLFINGGNFTSTGTFTVTASSGSGTGFYLQAGNATFATLTTDDSGSNSVHPYIIVAGGNLNATTLTVQRNSGTTTTFASGIILSGGNTNVSGTVTAASADSNGALSVQGGNLTAGTIVLGAQSTAGRGAVFQITSGDLNVTNTTNGGFVLVKNGSTGVAQIVTATFSGGISNLAELTFGFASNVTTGTVTTLNIDTGAEVFIGTGGIVNNAGGGVTNTFNLNGGLLGASGNWSSSLGMTLAGTSFQTADENNNPFNITLSGILTGTAALNQSGGGTLSLGALNTYSGNTTINGGTIAVSTLDIGGNASGLGESSNAPANLVITNGTLQYLGSTNATTDRSFTIGGTSATLDASGAGNASATFSNTTAMNFATPGVATTFTLTGTSTGANTLAANIIDNGAGPTSLVKNGTGAWVATGTNTLTGPTSINAGTLTINNLPNSNVTINPGGALNPVSGVGTLTIPGLTLAAPSGSANATLNFDFASTSSYDLINVTGLNGLTLDGGGFNLYQTGSTATWTTPGIYDLIEFNGAVQGSLPVADLVVLNPFTGLHYSFDTNGNFIELDITGALPPNSWSLDADGVWSNPSNWSTGVPPATATANFLGSAITAPRTITLDGSQTIAGLYFSSSNAYTIAPGSGTLSLVNDPSPGNITVDLGNHTISAPVTLDALGLVTNITAGNSLTLSGNIGDNGTGANITTAGNGTLFLAGNNTYSGGTVLKSGILDFNSTANFGTGNITFQGGTLQWAAGTSTDISSIPLNFNGSSAIFDTNGNNVTLAGNIGTGSTGSLTKTGNGVLTLTGTNTYSGGTNLLGGELSFTTTSNFGTGGLTFNGGGLQWGTGITTDISGIPMTFAGPGILDTNGNNVTLANPIGNSGPGALVKNGLGVLTLSANETYTGNTTINAGTIALALGTALPANSLITINSSGNLDVSGVNSTISYASGTGILNVGASTLTIGSPGLTGNFSGVVQGNGTINVNGGGASNWILSGTSPYTGAINVNAGTLEIGNGANLTSVGAVTTAATNGVQFYVHGGNFTTGSLFTTNLENLPGYFQDGGVANLNGGLRTNPSTTADGTILKVSGGILNTTTINLARTGNQTNTNTPYTSGFIQNGGTVNVSGNVAVGTVNSYGSVSIQGGNFNVAGAIILGDQTSAGRGGVMQVLGGNVDDTDTVNGLVLVQNNTTAAAVGQLSNITFGGGNSYFNIVNFGMDSTAQGTGAIFLTGGNVYIGSGGIAQRATGMGASVTLTSGNLGATANWTSPVTFTLSGGNITAADASNNPYTVTLTGNVAGFSDLNKTGSGTLVLANSDLATINYTGNTNINGGTLQIGNGGANGSLGTGGGSVVNDNATLAFNLSSNYSVGLPIGGTGALQQNGTGVTTLTLSSTYTGNTTLNAGTLVVDNTLASSNITVNSGATLSGTSTLAGNVSLKTGGIIAPGDINTVGIITLGSLTLAANSVLDFEFNTNPANDEIIVSNSGGLVINGGGFNLYQEGSTLPFVTPGTYTGLIQYTGAIGGAGNSSLYVANSQLGLKYTISAISGEIQITIADNFGNNTWTDTSGGANWSSASSWSSVFPSTSGHGPSGIGITVNFPNILSSEETVTTDQNSTFGTLNFASNPSNPGATGYDLEDGGGILTLNNNGTAAVINNLSGINVINSPLVMTANGTVANISAGTSLTLGGVISDTTPATLTINGTGNLTLGGANTYRGGTILNGATLDLINSAALGTGNFTINGGNLDNTANSQTILTGLGQQFWNGNFTYLGSNNFNLDLGSSNITLGNSIQITIDQNTLSVEGNISGAGLGLTEVGPGGLNLNGVSTFNGGLTVNGGSVNFGIADAIAPANNVTIINSGNFNLNTFDQSVAAVSVTNGTIAGSGNLSATSFTLQNALVSPTLAGTGSLTLTSGTATLFGASNFTGSTTILAGNLTLSGGNNRLPATTTVALGSTGNTAILILGDTTGAVSQTLSGLTLAAGTGSVRGGNTTSNSTLDLNIASGDDIYTGILGDSTNSTTSAGNHLALIKDGAGEFDLQGGNSTFLGGITLDAGTLGLTANATVAGVGPITFNGGALLAGNTTASVSGTYANPLVIPTGITANITTVGTTNQTFSGTVSGNGTLDMAIGPVTSFSGNLALAAFNGTINLSTNGSLRLQGAFDHGLNNATVNLGTDGILSSRDGSNQTIGLLLGGPGSNLDGSTVAGNLDFVIGTLNVDDTFSGNINNGNIGTVTGIDKVGTANLTLAGTGSYLGNTTISAGTLILGSGTGVSPNSTVDITSTGNFDINGQTAFIGGLTDSGPTALAGGALTTGLGNGINTYSGVLSGIGSFTKAGTGTLTLTNTETFVGPTTVSSGKLLINGNLAASDVTVASGAAVGGTGVITGNLTLQSGGQLSLGPSLANLTASNFSWSTNGTASLFFALSSSNSTSDTLNLSGNFAQGSTPGGTGQFIFNFENTGFFGGVYDLINFAPGEGIGFVNTDFAYTGLHNGMTGTFNYNNPGGILTFNVAPIPEPADAALALGALALLAARRRRARQSATRS